MIISTVGRNKNVHKISYVYTPHKLLIWVSIDVHNVTTGSAQIDTNRRHEFHLYKADTGAHPITL